MAQIQNVSDPPDPNPMYNESQDPSARVGDYNGGLLETRRYYRLGQGEVQNVSEDTCQLVSTFSEYGLVIHLALVNVNLFKGLSHIGY